jgi:putative transposase
VLTDLWSKKIMGWPIGPNITAELLDDGLKGAITRKDPLKAA